MIGIGATTAGLAIVGSAALWMRPTASSAVDLRPDDATLVTLGGMVYANQCASCHGADLEGEPNWRERGADGRLPAPPHDETGHTWHHPDEVLFNLTKHGMPIEIGNGEPYYSNMPAYETVLSDEEIVAVLSYIKSRWPADIRARHDELNAQMVAR